MATRTISIQKAFSFGWEATLKNYSFLIPFILVMIVANYALSSAQNKLHTPGTSFESATIVPYFLVTIASILISALFSLALIRISLKIVDGKKTGWEDIIFDLPLTLRYLGASIIYGIILALGFVALIIPGIYLALTYCYFGYFIVDKQCGALEALHESGEITKGAKLSILLFGIVAAIVVIISILPFGLGLLLSIPTLAIANTHLYRQLSGKIVIKEEVVTKDEPEA